METATIFEPGSSRANSRANSRSNSVEASDNHELIRKANNQEG